MRDGAVRASGAAPLPFQCQLPLGVAGASSVWALDGPGQARRNVTSLLSDDGTALGDALPAFSAAAYWIA